MKNKIGLNELKCCLAYSLIELNHNFIKNMIVSTAGIEEPYKNESFVKKLNLNYNKNVQKCTGLYSLFSKNRAVRFHTLAKIVEHSKYSWEDVQKNVILIRSGRSKGKIHPKFPIKLNKNLGRIFGHILGDGSIDRRYLQVFYTNKNKKLILEFIDCMKLVFNIEPRIWVQDSGNFVAKSKWVNRIKNPNEIEDNLQVGLFYPSICGLILNHILPNFAVGRDKNIPLRALNTPLNFQKGLIGAFFDDEGSADASSRSLRFYNDNLRVLAGIRTILKNIGIEPKDIRDYIKNGRKRHYFNICSYPNIKKFYKEITISSVKKRQNIENYLKQHALPQDWRQEKQVALICI